jgi:hypothetical protein
MLAYTTSARAAPNNGMHPTPHQRASHARCAGARVMPGVRQNPKVKKASRLLGLVKDAIRRVDNPGFIYRFSKDRCQASEYLFDRTDALIYIAKEWGGYEFCLYSFTLYFL